VKTWQLVVVQLWVLCFVPVWAFIAIFAPMTLTPDAWPAFVVMASPPVIAFVCSVAMWIARVKNQIQWQKRMAVVLIVFPVTTVVFPFFIFE